MNAPETNEPLAHFQQGERHITILGTAHVSHQSAETVRQLLSSGDYDAVAIELCPSRYETMRNPDALARMDLFRVVKEGKASFVVASLALGAYQQRIAEQVGIEPGAEMKAAIEVAEADGHEIILIDREVGTTLKRVYRNVSFWKRLEILVGLLGSAVSRDKVSEDDIEHLKEGDVLENTFTQFAEDQAAIYEPLVAERDRYMAARLLEALDDGEHKHILAVVGAGHLAGIEKTLNAGMEKPAEKVRELDTIPPPSRWPKLIPWVIVALVLLGFTIGFSKNTNLGIELLIEWVLINGGLSALGAAIATAHPLTILGAFVAAPLTSLNPTIGAGMVTAGIELWLRKPKVGDFGSLRHDTAHLKGWWKNPVARTLLVFLFSTMGSAIGTYVAGFRIFDRLAGA